MNKHICFLCIALAVACVGCRSKQHTVSTSAMELDTAAVSICVRTLQTSIDHIFTDSLNFDSIFIERPELSVRIYGGSASSSRHSHSDTVEGYIGLDSARYKTTLQNSTDRNSDTTAVAYPISAWRIGAILLLAIIAVIIIKKRL